MPECRICGNDLSGAMQLNVCAFHAGITHLECCKHSCSWHGKPCEHSVAVHRKSKE